MKILILIFLAAGFFLLFYEMGALRYLAGTLRRTREGVDAAARQRSLADRQKLLDLQEEHSFWYFLEQLLQYSGIRRRFPGMTAEWMPRATTYRTAVTGFTIMSSSSRHLAETASR